MANMAKQLKGDNDSYAILQILMDDGSRITDKRAMKVGTEVLSDAMGGIEVPLRKPTPSYEASALRAPAGNPGGGAGGNGEC